MVNSPMFCRTCSECGSTFQESKLGRMLKRSDSCRARSGSDTTTHGSTPYQNLNTLPYLGSSSWQSCGKPLTAKSARLPRTGHPQGPVQWKNGGRQHAQYIAMSRHWSMISLWSQTCDFKCLLPSQPSSCWVYQWVQCTIEVSSARSINASRKVCTVSETTWAHLKVKSHVTDVYTTTYAGQNPYTQRDVYGWQRCWISVSGCMWSSFDWCNHIIMQDFVFIEFKFS